MPRKRRKRVYGQGSAYLRGSLWTIKWREGGRVRYKHGYETRETAELVLAKIALDVKAQTQGLPPDPKGVPTLATLAEPWLERRKTTHRAARQDKSRWGKHLKGFFGARRPAEVDAAAIRAFVEAKLAEKLNPATVGHCLRLLSTFYADLVERGLAPANPVRTVPRATRRLYRPTTDPRNTPFLETLAVVKKIFRALPDPVSVAFAIGALGGLRTGEVLGLDWCDIDIAARRIRVRQQVNNGSLAPLKDDESRIVPILKPLAPILAAYRTKTGGEGLLFRPRHPTRGGRPGRPATFLRPTTLYRPFEEALATVGLSGLTWYQGTRHTFASHWVLGGGSIEKLANIMGHSSVVVTERYAHLRPDLFREEEDYDVLNVTLVSTPKKAKKPASRRVSKRASASAIGYNLATMKEDAGAQNQT